MDASPENNPAPDSDSQSAECIIKLPRISPVYRLTVLVVCAAMVLLPLIYFAFAAAVGLGVLYFAVHYYHVLTEGSLRFEVIGLFPFYAVPLVGGILLTLLLIKPFFAPRRADPEMFPLTEEDAPELFDLIRWICQVLHAPLPSRVEVNCSVNASVGLRGTTRRMFNNDVVLSIGLPLVAGLNCQQLAGVIAHEYGHLSRGKTMRADFFIQQINRWFYDAVYEPDDWDLYLREKCEDENQRLSLVIFLSVLRAGIAVGRGVLWLLLVTGNLFSSLLSRQMEFDADQYELKISGSKNFISTTLRLQQLNLGLATAQKQMIAKWRKEQKLFDRIPDFIVSRADEISADTQEVHYARVFRRQTGLFDRHPSDAERTRRAREANEAGVLEATAPARNLFGNYRELSRCLTLFFYRDLIGAAFSSESLVSHEKNPVYIEHDYDADQANIVRHFIGVATDLRPQVLVENKSLICRPQEILREEIVACQRLMNESLPQARAALSTFTLATQMLERSACASELIAAGFQVEPADFGLSDGDTDAAQTEMRLEMEKAGKELEIFEMAGRLRLLNAVQLLPLPWMAARIPEAVKLQDEAREMIHVLSRLENVFRPLQELRALCVTLKMLLAYSQTQPAADNAAMILENICMETQERVNAIQEITAQIRYPFEHETGHVMIGEFLRNKEYHVEPRELTLREGRSHVENLFRLYHRLLARVASICALVENEIARQADEAESAGRG